MDETMEAVDDDEELEQEADEEVDKVLYELTDGKLGQAGRVGGELPVCHICPLICLDLSIGTSSCKRRCKLPPREV